MFSLVFGVSLLFQSISCLIEKLDPTGGYKIATYIMSEENTVHFVQTELKERRGASFKSLEDGALSTRLSVYRGSETGEKTLFCNDDKSSEQNTFFFTTPASETYYLVLEVLTEDENLKKNLGIDYKIFAGEAKRPSIVSTNDVEVSRAETLTRRVLEYVKKNIAVQNMDEEGEAIYKQLYANIMKSTILVALFKMAVTMITMFYSNKKTKTFYSQQGITGK